MLTADEIRKLLKLEPHPKEGGYFVQTYKSGHALPPEVLAPGYPSERSIGTAIYYLLAPETFSAMHRLPGDEGFHFYMGDTVEMLQLKPDGTGEVVLLGTDIASGMRPQIIVPGEVWQGSRLRAGGKFALMGNTMSPGYEDQDYETGSREELIAQYPEFSTMIAALTR